MKKQAQEIYKHFGDEKQRLKAKEERLKLLKKWKELFYKENLIKKI